MTDHPPIHMALAAAMSNAKPAGRDKANQHQGFKYRSIDEVVNAAHGALADAGVFLMPVEDDAEWPNANTARLKVRYRFYGPAGDFLDSTVTAEASSPGRALSAAWTYALKTVLVQVLCLSYGDDDPDGHPTAPATEPSVPQPRKPSVADRARAKMWVLLKQRTTDQATQKQWMRETLQHDFEHTTDLSIQEVGYLIECLEKGNGPEDHVA